MIARKMRPRPRWGYKIDYDKEIAVDQAEIDQLDSSLARAVSASLTSEEIAWMERSGGYDAYAWLWFSPELAPRRARLLGLSERDLVVLAARIVSDAYGPMDKVDAWIIEYADRLPKGSSYYRESDALLKQLEDVPVMREELRSKLVKKAKASLSRHKRNKEKFG